MEIKIANREWVKNAAIIFLAILLVLTFFSNTIMNRSLVEVATANVTDGSIVAKVRGTGKVTANGRHQVKAPETRTIGSVLVKSGQEVNAGDVLFVLGAGDVTELEQAEERLRELKYDYQRSALSMPSFNYIAEERALDNAEKAELAALKELEDAENAYYMMEDKLIDDGTRNRLEQAEAELADAYNKYLEVQGNYDEAYHTLAADVADLQMTVNCLSGEIIEAEPDPALDAELAQAQAELAAAQKALDDFVAANASTLEHAKSVYDRAEEKYNAIAKYRDEIALGLVPYQEKLDAAQAKYDTAVNTRADAESTLYLRQDADARTLAAASVNLQQISENIKLQQEKVKSLAGDESNTVLAKVSGIIDTVDCTAGDTVTKDALLCTIEVPDMGHTLSFSVTNEQAQRLRTGDTATVSNFYWGNSITATLTSIRTDPKSPQSNKLLTFDLEGEVTTGSELTISVGQKSANYDLVIPNSSIKSDTNGSFVYAIDAKSSPLGNRYMAKRVSVEVLAADDMNSAVVADLNNGDFVITTTSAPIKNGEQVRLADSNS